MKDSHQVNSPGLTLRSGFSDRPKKGLRAFRDRGAGSLSHRGGWPLCAQGEVVGLELEGLAAQTSGGMT